MTDADFLIPWPLDGPFKTSHHSLQDPSSPSPLTRHDGNVDSPLLGALLSHASQGTAPPGPLAPDTPRRGCAHLQKDVVLKECHCGGGKGVLKEAGVVLHRHSPTSAAFSTTMTRSSLSSCWARCMSLMAALSPAGPPPTTTTSASSSYLSMSTS
ncbi:hypothetical protein E2C01_045518 [Portunus trituberculatus]|uniref:Uncharacterized protein n=1 Tax=Portunus trituberculatus TaxID=210409 RepID=A0A5B7G1E5_PORTR|nr:hypothetical protein [Portunus trituberculatus]